MTQQTCAECGHDEQKGLVHCHKIGCPCKKFKSVEQEVEHLQGKYALDEAFKDNHSPDDLSRKSVNPDKGKIAQDTPEDARGFVVNSTLKRGSEIIPSYGTINARGRKPTGDAEVKG